MAEARAWGWAQLSAKADCVGLGRTGGVASVGEAAQLSLAMVLGRDSGLRSQSQIRVSSVLTRLVMSRQSSHFIKNLYAMPLLACLICSCSSDP